MTAAEVKAAFEEWQESLSEGWWDDDGDASGFLDNLEEAFTAGWEACRQAWQYREEPV
jgi:hypothetical protein